MKPTTKMILLLLSKVNSLLEGEEMRIVYNEKRNKLSLQYFDEDDPEEPDSLGG